MPAGAVRDSFVEAEDLVNYPRSIGTTKVAALFREQSDGKVKVSLRAKGEVDVNAIAARFGGGGHFHEIVPFFFGAADGVAERHDADLRSIGADHPDLLGADPFIRANFFQNSASPP